MIWSLKYTSYTAINDYYKESYHKREPHNQSQLYARMTQKEEYIPS